MDKILGASVGFNGQNNPLDVKTIQILLNRHYANSGRISRNMPLKVNGKCGPETIGAIRDYQATVMHMAKPGSRIDPLSPTFQKLKLNWYSKSDEAYKILEYIIGEIKTNCQSDTVKKMREYNSFSVSKCFAEWKKEPILNRVLMAWGGAHGCTDKLISGKSMAFMLWAEKVRVDGEWDHKSYIANTFKFRVLAHQTQERHILGDHTYFYDIWSNINYGYVGMAAGFSESELLDGAGAEQFASDMLSGGLPEKTAERLRGWDHVQDRTSVGIGIDLYKKNPNTVAATDVLEKIRKEDGKIGNRPWPVY